MDGRGTERENKGGTTGLRLEIVVAKFLHVSSKPSDFSSGAHQPGVLVRDRREGLRATFLGGRLGDGSER